MKMRDLLIKKRGHGAFSFFPQFLSGPFVLLFCFVCFVFNLLFNATLPRAQGCSQDECRPSKALGNLRDVTTHERARDPALPSWNPAWERGGGPAAEGAQGQGGRHPTGQGGREAPGDSKLPAHAPLSHRTSLKTQSLKDKSKLQEGDQRN